MRVGCFFLKVPFSKVGACVPPPKTMTDNSTCCCLCCCMQAGLGTRHGVFARGAAINIAADGSANICFGASSGLLHVLEVDEVGRFRGPSTFAHHTAPITAIGSAYQSRQGRFVTSAQRVGSDHDEAPSYSMLMRCGTAPACPTIRWTEDLASSIITADESGEVAVWAAESAGSYKVGPWYTMSGKFLRRAWRAALWD